MDPVAFFLLMIPTKYVSPILAAIGVAAIADSIVPKADPGAAWYVRYPRAALHYLGINWDEARTVLRKV